MPYSTIDHIEILIATMDRDDLAFLETMFSLPLSSINFKILVVNQSLDRKITSQYPLIRVINDPNYGLCRSRNIAIEQSIGNYLWILDDDVQLVTGWLEKITAAIERYPDYAALTFKAQSPDGSDMRAYATYGFDYSKKHIEGNPVSFEIVLNKNRLQSTGIRFNELFGLGAPFPLCEEQLLFYSLLQAGERMRFIPSIIVVHPKESSGTNPIVDKVIYARGAMASWLEQPIFLFKHKYAFFLWRQGYINSWNQWRHATQNYARGAADYQRIASTDSNAQF